MAWAGGKHFICMKEARASQTRSLVPSERGAGSKLSMDLRHSVYPHGLWHHGVEASNAMRNMWHTLHARLHNPALAAPQWQVFCPHLPQQLQRLIGCGFLLCMWPGSGDWCGISILRPAAARSEMRA
jgi:hypothetical protein